jgi:hypothetical protein
MHISAAVSCKYSTNISAVSDVVQVIASEGELKASRALKEAADVIQESPSALQVLYLYKGTVTQDKFNLY